MKIKITLKDPDTLYDAISDAVNELEIDGLDSDELEAVRELRKETFREVAAEWFEFGEYVTLEMDTEEQTIKVLTLKELKD